MKWLSNCTTKINAESGPCELHTEVHTAEL